MDRQPGADPVNADIEGLRSAATLVGFALYIIAMCIGLYLVFKLRNWDGK